MKSAKNPRLVSMAALAAAMVAAGTLSGGAAVAAEQQGANEGMGLGEIIVTAQRRQESAQDVPIAISAVTSEMIERQRINSPTDLAMHVPGLVFNEFVGYAQPYLRGIGTDISQPNGEPSVATYVDGVYVANAQGVLNSMLGTDHVEVLVGPQGTLYGRNAVGGAINYYTLSPGDTFETKVTAGYGNYNRKEVNGHVSGPLSDKFALGIYGAYMDRDTYLHRDFPVRPAAEPDGVTQWGTRVKAVFEPTNDIKLTGSLTYTDTKSPEEDAYRQIQANALGYVFGATEGPPPKYHTNADFAQYNKVQQFGATLREEADLGFAKLLGITGYRDMEGKGSADYDATSAPVFAFGPPVLTKAKQFSQELQLLSPDESKIQWIAGLYYFHERAGQYDFSALSDFILAPANEIKFIGRVTTESYAAFGQVTVPFGDFRLTGGLRYSADQKDFDGEQRLLLNGVNILEIPIPDRSEKWHNWSPKVTLDYRIDKTLLYGTFSKGYKAGMFNVNIPTDPGPVDPEKMTSFEAGIKSDFLDGRLRTNISAYHYKVKDLQVQTVRPSSNGSTVVQNAASAKIKGIDGSVIVALTPEITASVDASYSDPKYSNFPDYGAVVPAAVGNTVVFIDASGNRLARAPKYTFGAALDYDHTFENEGRVTASLKGHYTGDYFWDASNLYEQNGYWLVNASVAYTLPQTPLTVSLWGTNLTDQYYNTILNASAFGTGVFDAPPRMYGVTLTYELGG